ncbi:MAG: methylated-DNA--[protein]-cysteine S-methyltransferase [Acidimicrobiia bacterium]|nr:methylated-DNA--[protein]-cysteine S-methyltransferase [Acidimicrobiia bacterium]
MSTLTRTVTPSPVGELQIITSEIGIVAILWPDDDRWDYDTIDGSNAIADQATRELTEFFDGSRTNFTVPLDLRGTEFQRAVWESLTEIPFGQTVSYAEQAARLGRPTAVRAVASANGKNPVSIMVPCHRVIGSNGTLTGYAGGLEAKRLLLDLERGQQPLIS